MTKRSIKIPKTARFLGYSGLVPFLMPTFLLWFDFGYSQEVVLFFLLAYGASILSFLGGVLWGKVIWGTNLEQKQRRFSISLVISIFPALLAWVSILIQPVYSLPLLAVCFGALFFVETKYLDVEPRIIWYPHLRKPLTVVVILSLIISWNSLLF